MDKYKSSRKVKKLTSNEKSWMKSEMGKRGQVSIDTIIEIQKAKGKISGLVLSNNNGKDNASTEFTYS